MGSEIGNSLENLPNLSNILTFVRSQTFEARLHVTATQHETSNAVADLFVTFEHRFRSSQDLSYSLSLDNTLPDSAPLFALGALHEVALPDLAPTYTAGRPRLSISKGFSWHESRSGQT